MLKLYSVMDGVDFINTIKQFVPEHNLLISYESFAQLLLDGYCNRTSMNYALKEVTGAVDKEALRDRVVEWVGVRLMRLKIQEEVVLHYNSGDIEIFFKDKNCQPNPLYELLVTLRDDIERGIVYPTHIRVLIEKVDPDDYK